MIIDFKNENCTDCDIHIRTIYALYMIAKNELDHNGTTDLLLSIAQAIGNEAGAMSDLVSKQQEL